MKPIFNYLAGAALLMGSLSLQSCMTNRDSALDDNTIRLLLGSYGSGDKERVQLYSFNQATGEASYVCGLKGIKEASFVSIAPDGKHFYAVSETDDKEASLFAAEIVEGDSTEMRIINSQPTNGEAPCYVNVENGGRFAFTANYNGSNFTMFEIDPTTGALLDNQRVERFVGNGPVTYRQEKSHIHCVEFTPDTALLLVNDLGTDKIHAFPIDKQSTDIDTYINKEKAFDIDIEPGSGPRHITFAPDGRYAYLMNEISGMVTVLKYEEGTLTPVQYALSDSVHAQGSADIHISPDGLFLYASNRLKDDGISVFSINPDDGTIKKVGYQLTGIHPRNFAITPNGRYLLCACRDSNCIQIFERDATTGLLKDTGKKIDMEKPVCVKSF